MSDPTCERCQNAVNDPMGLYFCEEHATNCYPPWRDEVMKLRAERDRLRAEKAEMLAALERIWDWLDRGGPDDIEMAYELDPLLNRLRRT